MLTIFAIPKPFIGHIATIQKNAIHSWTLLEPRPEIILFGNEEEAADLCKEFGLRHILDVKRNKYGTPLLNDIFKKAHRLASNNTLCFLNADIILMKDFMLAVERAVKSKSRFLMLGERWDFDLTEILNYGNPDWEDRLMDRVRKYGIRHGFSGVDYYVFPKGVFENIPPFAIGRMFYDNWFIYHARSLGISVIDTTKVVTSIHQDHERTYASLGKKSVAGENFLRNNKETKENFKLVGNTFDRIYNLLDSTHVMTQDGIKPALQFKYLKRRLGVLRVQGWVSKAIARFIEK